MTSAVLISMSKTSEIVKESKLSKFNRYRDGEFIYQTDTGFPFSIPMRDVDGATLLAEDKTLFFMRWIRAQVETNEKPGVVPETTREQIASTVHPPEHSRPSSSLTDDPADPRLHQQKENGQNEVYLILSDEERAKGFIRPLRRSYIHSTCGTKTYMGLKLCETYARNPKFYGATFCCGCNTHLPVGEFNWAEDGEVVGS